MTNWPDPARPGVPLNPGLPGAHWLKGYTEDAWMYDGDGGWWGPGYSHKLDAETVAAHYSYLGPVLLPDEATALQKRVAELEGALGTLEKAASYTAKLGAVTGAHWLGLGTALIKARDALGGKDE